MRTTVEIKPEHRTALLALAAQRGQKDFSAVLSEAIESYLMGAQERARQRETLLELAGSLSAEEAEELRQVTQAIRTSWR